MMRAIIYAQLLLIMLMPHTAFGTDTQAFEIDKLNAAILSNDLPTLKRLLNSGIDPNMKGSDETYPLEWILPMENCEAFEILLSQGADPKLASRGGVPIDSLIRETKNKTLIAIMNRYAHSVSN